MNEKARRPEKQFLLRGGGLDILLSLCPVSYGRAVCLARKLLPIAALRRFALQMPGRMQKAVSDEQIFKRGLDSFSLVVIFSFSFDCGRNFESFFAED